MLVNIEERKAFITKGEVIVYVAEHEGRIIGFTIVSPKTNKLLALYVISGNWKNVGKNLLMTVENQTRKMGASFLEGETSSNAKEFYRRCGYEISEASEHELPIGLTIPCYKIRKDLTHSL